MSTPQEWWARVPATSPPSLPTDPAVSAQQGESFPSPAFQASPALLTGVSPLPEVAVAKSPSAPVRIKPVVTFGRNVDSIEWHGLSPADPADLDHLPSLTDQADLMYGHSAKGKRSHRGDVFSVLVGLGAGASVAAAFLVGWADRTAPGGWFTFGGQLSAMLGTYLALVAVLLSSRLPFLEREIGHDRMIAWHRTVGPAALFLILAHVVLTTLGWAINGEIGFVSQFMDLVLNYEWMMPALVAFIIMMALGLSSWRRVRRKMKYETWHVAHLYFYLAILLAYGHQVAFGSMFTEYPVIATSWLSLYVAVFGTVVVFRILLPIAYSLRHRLVVEEVVEEAPGVVSVYMRGRNLHKLKVKGGQFFAWRFMTRHFWWQAHPYSLSAGSDPNVLRITVKNLGDHSGALAEIHPGTRVIAEGPYGVFTADKRHGETVVGIAAGVGITPIRAMMDDLPDETDVTLIYRVRTEDDLALRAELDRAAAVTGWNMVYLTGDNDQHQITAAFLQSHAPAITESDVFICGPGPFASLVLAALNDLGVQDKHIHHEQFAF